MFPNVIIKNAGYQAIARLAVSGVSFVITLIIARQLGVAGYGDFTKVTAFVGLFYLIVDFGLNAIFLQQRSHFRDLLYGRIGISILLILFINIIVWALPYQQEGLGFSWQVRFGIGIFSFSLLSQALLFSASAVFQQQLRYKSFMLASAVGSIVALLTVLLFIAFTQSFVFLFVPILFGSFVTGTVALWFTKEKLFPVRVDIRVIKKLFLASWPIGVMLLINLVYFRIDMVLLSFLRPTTEVGVYGLAYRFFDFLIALPLFLSNALYPSMLMEEKFFQKSYVKAYALRFFLLSIPLVVLCWLAAPLIGFIRTEYIPAVVPFRILLVSLPLFFVTNILQWVLIAQKQQKYLLIVYLLCAIMTVILNIIFIPVASYVAAAIITVFAEAVVLLLLLGKVFVSKL